MQLFRDLAVRKIFSPFTAQWQPVRSDKIPIITGVKQGCVLAPTLFDIFLAALLLRAYPKPSGILLHTLQAQANCLISLDFVPCRRSTALEFMSFSTQMMLLLSRTQTLVCNLLATPLPELVMSSA